YPVDNLDHAWLVILEELTNSRRVPQRGAMMGGAGVVATGRRHRIVLEHAVHRARVVHGDLQTFDVDRIALGATTNLSGGAERALGEQIANALTTRDHADQLDDLVGVAEAQRDSAGIFVGEQPFLVALHRPGNRRAAGD